MFLSEKVISAPCGFTPRFVTDFVQSIVAMKSHPYISTLDKNINAKSILGLLSANIKTGDSICVQVVNNCSKKQAEEDLSYILKLILGDDK